GLTFEKVIIDAQEAFAHGQTYVALSRCKTLEGIVLKTPITNNCIINNHEVATFTKNVEQNQPDERVLKASKITFQLHLLEEFFDFYEFIHPLNRLLDIFYKNRMSIQGNLPTSISIIKDKGITPLLKVAATFKSQLETLSQNELPEDNVALQERFVKAVAYFDGHSKTFLRKPLDELTFSTDNKAIQKDIVKHLETIETSLSAKLFFFKGLRNGFSSQDYLKLKTKALFQKTEQVKKPKNDYINTTEHPQLFERLRELRAQFAVEEDVAHYQVFTQKALYEMCHVLPSTMKQLAAITDIGKTRLKKYGQAILEIIIAYCDKNSLEANLEIPKSDTRATPEKSNTKLISLQLFKNGKSIPEIAKERDLTVGTIEGHLASFIPTGEIDVFDLISEDKFEELKKIMEIASFETFTDLRNKTENKFTYGEMRLVASSIEHKKN
ncbi:MAG: helix-turn-helix domain-containing protein, partial [Gelidibacter sp.]